MVTLLQGASAPPKIPVSYNSKSITISVVFVSMHFLSHEFNSCCIHLHEFTSRCVHSHPCVCVCPFPSLHPCTHPFVFCVSTVRCSDLHVSCVVVHTHAHMARHLLSNGSASLRSCPCAAHRTPCMCSSTPCVLVFSRLIWNCIKRGFSGGVSSSFCESPSG